MVFRKTLVSKKNSLSCVYYDSLYCVVLDNRKSNIELILKYISELLKNTANVNIINFCKPVILYYSPTILKFRTLGKKTIDLFSNNIPIESFEYILEPGDIFFTRKKNASEVLLNHSIVPQIKNRK